MNWSYIAGFFDGEGCLTKRSKGRGLNIYIANTDLSILEAIYKFLGYGHIDGPYNYGKNKDYYCLYIGHSESVEDFLVNIKDKLVGEKRKEANKLFNHFKDDPPRKRVSQRKKIINSREVFWCPDCERYLSRDNFYKHRTYKYEIGNYCKECVRKRKRKYRIRKIG